MEILWKDSFRRGSGDSPVWKLCVSTKFPHQGKSDEITVFYAVYLLRGHAYYNIFSWLAKILRHSHGEDVYSHAKIISIHQLTENFKVVIYK